MTPEQFEAFLDVLREIRLRLFWIAVAALSIAIWG